MRKLLSVSGLGIAAQLAMLGAILVFVGCGNPAELAVKKLFRPSADTDVTSLPRYNFSSFSGTVWQTKGKTAIAEGKRYTGAPETSLLASYRFDPTEPNYTSIDTNDTRIITVLPIGTRIRIQRLMKDNGAWGGVNVAVTLLDGTNAQTIVFLDGAMLANNIYLHFGLTESTNWGVNPEMLAPNLDPGHSTQSASETVEAPQAGFEKGYANGKKSAIEAPNFRYGYRGVDPWLGGGEMRPNAVKLHSEEYVAAYESGYNKGFQDFFQKSVKETRTFTNSGVNPETLKPVSDDLKK